MSLRVAQRPLSADKLLLERGESKSHEIETSLSRLVSCYMPLFVALFVLILLVTAFTLGVSGFTWNRVRHRLPETSSLGVTSYSSMSRAASDAAQQNPACASSAQAPQCDYAGPLRVEYHELGYPTIVGTPAAGPQNGVGSYWYQIGRIQGREEAKLNLAGIVQKFMIVAGRSAEFRGPGWVGVDMLFRKRTYTPEQWTQQITTLIQQGKLRREPVDFFDAYFLGIRDHVQDILSGLAPMPAEFVAGVGQLEHVNLATDLVGLLTIPNFLNGHVLFAGYGFTNERGAIVQQENLAKMLAVAPVDPTGGIASNKIFDDIFGINGVSQHRWTAAEGDRYATGTAVAAASLSSRSFGTASAVAPAWGRAYAEGIRNMTENYEAAFGGKNPFSGGMSDHFVVSPKISKHNTTIMYGNSQFDIPFESQFHYPLLTLRTPRASVSSSTRGIRRALRAGEHTGYTTFTGVEVNVRPKRDAVIEDESNLVKIYDPTAVTEAVVGGQSHSTIKIRNPSTGAITTTVISIYQGGVRKGLQTGAVFVNPANASDVKIVIVRNPRYWMRDALYLNFFAHHYMGAVPINNLDHMLQVTNTWDGGEFHLTTFGHDSDGNIFTMAASNVHELVNPAAYDRKFPQDATNGAVFANAIGRPLPVPAESEYILEKPTLVRNPPSGYILGWNLQFATHEPLIDLTTTRTQFEFNRVAWMHRYAENMLAKNGGKIDFEDVRGMFAHVQLGRHMDVLDASQNYGADVFSALLQPTLLAALDTHGLAVGLTAPELARVKTLLGESYPGWCVPNRDLNDRVAGKDFDGRWVLANAWVSMLEKTLMDRAVPDAAFRAALNARLALITPSAVPTADWTPTSPSTSRVFPAQMGSTFFLPILIRVIRAGPQINTNAYAWSSTAGINTHSEINEFIAQGLKDALALLVTGSNAGTGLADPSTGRANLGLIMNDGYPLHPGWGRNQRPLAQLRTNMLYNNIAVRTNIPVLNRMGTLGLREQNPCTKELVHHQVGLMHGVGALITNHVVNGTNVQVVGAHTIDAAEYFDRALGMPEMNFC